MNKEDFGNDEIVSAKRKFTVREEGSKKVNSINDLFAIGLMILILNAISNLISCLILNARRNGKFNGKCLSSCNIELKLLKVVHKNHSNALSAIQKEGDWCTLLSRQS